MAVKAWNYLFISFQYLFPWLFFLILPDRPTDRPTDRLSREWEGAMENETFMGMALAEHVVKLFSNNSCFVNLVDCNFSTNESIR